MKRGQVTAFIIVGILALLAIAFVFFARGEVLEKLTKTTNVQQKLQFEIKLVEDEIGRCINEETSKAVSTIASQGGFFNPLRYRSYYGQKFTYLCTKVEGQDNCVNQVVSQQNIKERMDVYLEEQINNCVDLSLFRGKSYTLNTGELTVFTSLSQKNVLLNVTFPITLSQDDFTVKKETYFKTVNYPLGEVLDVVNDITSSEAENGAFDALSYNILTNPDYDIQIRKPYPDTIYILTPEGYETKFQFAIQG